MTRPFGIKQTMNTVHMNIIERTTFFSLPSSHLNWCAAEFRQCVVCLRLMIRINVDTAIIEKHNNEGTVYMNMKYCVFSLGVEL